MIEYSAQHFDDLCRDDSVRAEIGAIEEKRRKAVRRFWLLLVGSIVLGLVVLVSLAGAEWVVSGLVLGVLVIVVGIVAGVRPLTAAKEELKHPVLEALARRGGMEYLPSGFDPPVFPSAGRILFGGISSHSFTDLFHGTDSEGKRFAVYEGTLTRRQGKNTVTVFTGQLYAFQRRSPSGGETAIVPDKGIFNFFKPSGMERVKFDTDPAFEKKFEVYASQPAAASLLVGSDVRSELLQLREGGRVFAYVGAEDVLVAIWGKNRFEPGSMFRARSGQERVKLMFDDVCAAMGVLRRLKSVLD
ncbi:MAG TPA: DUF3137 domain-containing protein [Allosphingosinicella sp.]|nr:DUF3137 domain-containing protein [Allosphingosinicella sp.]